MERKRAVFLDLNGTVVLPLKPEGLSELSLIVGADLAIKRLLAVGFVCPVITVQSRIEKGLFTESEFRKWFSEFFQQLKLDVKGPYVCPHRYNHQCSCRKPNVLLYDRASSDWSLDLRRSYMIGGSPEDMEAARRFGGTGCLVRTGWAAQNEFLEKASSSAAFIGATITDAVEWIISREQGHRM
jgi:D-glycero-D-manno-heptose 1,7-bisphosphate phosphatase